MSEELKPCAHCGSRGELVTYYDFYHINCTNDDCVEHYDESMIYRGEGAWYGSIADAIEAWNTRTPDQAIAATLGGVGFEVGSEVGSEVRGGKLTADQVRKAIFNGSSYASYDGAKYYADGIHMQAIADELNAALGGGECTPHGEWESISQTQEVRHVFCECGYELGMDERDSWPFQSTRLFAMPNFCPECGRKIRKAVKQ